VYVYEGGVCGSAGRGLTVVGESEDGVCRVGEEGGNVASESRYGCCVVFYVVNQSRSFKIVDGASKIATYLHDV
jgi:hypothetical protein